MESLVLPNPGEFKFIPVEPDASTSQAIITWSDLFKDHCLFLYYGLTHNPLVVEKLTAKSHPLPLMPEAINPTSPPAVEVMAVKESARELAGKWNIYASLAPFNLQLDTLMTLWNETYRLKHQVKDWLEQKLWIGSLSLSFVEGMLQELYYLRGRIDNTITPQQEVALFLDDAALHLAILSHHLDEGIIDPTVRRLGQNILNISEQGFLLRNKAQAEAITIQGIQKAIDYIHQSGENALEVGTFSSTGHPLALRHVFKEVEFELNRLTELMRML